MHTIITREESQLVATMLALRFDIPLTLTEQERCDAGRLQDCWFNEDLKKPEQLRRVLDRAFPTRVAA